MIHGLAQVARRYRSPAASGRVALLTLALLAAGACGPAGPAGPTFVPPASVRPIPTWTLADGPRPVLLDTDLDGDDLVAFAILLRDPGVDLRAVAVTGTGLVHCASGVGTARRVLAAFGRDDVPVACGRETPGPGGRAFPAEWRARADARWGLELPETTGAPGAADAATLIADTIRAGAGRLTIVAIGPWTNLQDAFAADPGLAKLVAAIHAMLGAIDAPGNVSIGDTDFDDRVEWNAGADPAAVAHVLGLDIPVTLVPLDATDDVPVPEDMPARLAPDHAAAGADLAFELYLRNPVIADEGQQLWDSLAAVLLTSPELATWEDLAVTVSTNGDTAGALSRSATGRPVRAAMAADATAVIDALLDALRRGAPRPEPFVPDGELRTGP